MPWYTPHCHSLFQLGADLSRATHMPVAQLTTSSQGHSAAHCCAVTMAPRHCRPACLRGPARGGAVATASVALLAVCLFACHEHTGTRVMAISPLSAGTTTAQSGIAADATASTRWGQGGGIGEFHADVHKSEAHVEEVLGTHLKVVSVQTTFSSRASTGSWKFSTARSTLQEYLVLKDPNTHRDKRIRIRDVGGVTLKDADVEGVLRRAPPLKPMLVARCTSSSFVHDGTKPSRHVPQLDGTPEMEDGRVPRTEIPRINDPIGQPRTG